MRGRRSCPPLVSFVRNVFQPGTSRRGWMTVRVVIRHTAAAQASTGGDRGGSDAGGITRGGAAAAAGEGLLSIVHSVAVPGFIRERLGHGTTAGQSLCYGACGVPLRTLIRPTCGGRSQATRTVRPLTTGASVSRLQTTIVRVFRRGI